MLVLALDKILHSYRLGAFEINALLNDWHLFFVGVGLTKQKCHRTLFI